MSETNQSNTTNLEPQVLDVIKSEIGIEIEESSQSADIFNKLKVRKNRVPIRPLTEGKLE